MSIYKEEERSRADEAFEVCKSKYQNAIIYDLCDILCGDARDDVEDEESYSCRNARVLLKVLEDDSRSKETRFMTLEYLVALAKESGAQFPRDLINKLGGELKDMLLDI
ncbi:hypothetical protein L1887_07545 [Cichorium endivia]|nr:hypothetical protein L1887_07545 [Cichorium endivia]